MFTGIIRHIGQITANTPQTDESIILEISAPFSSELSEGDSVAVQGACLTVLSHTDSAWTCRLMAETIKKTTLGSLSAGSSVNLEQPAQAGDLLHGHIVQGHVDGVCTISDIRPAGDDRVMTFQVPATHMQNIAPKGSIALDGVSLTIVDVLEDSFTVSFMPYTLSHTTFGSKKIGDSINIETDKSRKAAWFSGIAIEGSQKGRALGFPTANIMQDSSPAFSEPGIFACRVMIEGDPTLYAGALHSGSQPMYPRAEGLVEIYILHFSDRNLYQKRLTFTPVAKLRDSAAFSSEQELSDAIAQDVQNATAILSRTPLHLE